MNEKIDSLAHHFIQKSNTAGLCIGVINNGVVSTSGYGKITKRSGKAPDADTIFEIGSVTKTFAATILAWYVIEGKISLDDPITKYLPKGLADNSALQKIKVLHLSNHTSGLPRLPWNLLFRLTEIRNPYKGYSTKMLFFALKTSRLRSVPGEVYAYSNMAAGLLGVILEKISGKPFGQLVKEIITGPLKMGSTAQHLNTTLSARFVKIYNRWGFPVPSWDFDALAACGCLKSSVNDLLLYARANMTPGGDQLSKAFEIAHQITYKKARRLALGWHLLAFNGDDYYWHNGGTGGCRSFLIFNSQKNIAVIVLTNTAASCDGLAIDILKNMR